MTSESASERNGNQEFRIRGTRLFIWSVLVIFLVTALLKLMASTQSAGMLDEKDFLFPFLSRRQFLVVGGLLEIGYIALLWKVRSTRFALELVVWMSAVLSGYRGILHVYGDGAPCSCLGFYWGYVGSNVALGLILWCLIGSIAFSLGEYFSTQRSESPLRV